MDFLVTIYGVKKERFKFGLQIFGDLSPKFCLKFWVKSLGVNIKQFYKPIISPSQGKGTYKRKSKFGVVTIYFNNKKLRNILVNEIEKLRKV